MRKLLTLCCVLSLALVAVGCSSSDGSDGSGDGTATSKDKTTTTEGSTEDVEGITADGYTSAFVINLSSGSEDEGNLVISEEQATCVAPLFVDAITVKTLQANDVTTEEIEDPSWDGTSLGLSPKQGEKLVSSFGECDVDIVALFAEGLTGGLTAEQQSCVAENIDGDLVKAALAKTFSTGESDAEFEAVVTALGEDCELPGA